MQCSQPVPCAVRTSPASPMGAEVLADPNRRSFLSSGHMGSILARSAMQAEIQLRTQLNFLSVMTGHGAPPPSMRAEWGHAIRCNAKDNRADQPGETMFPTTEIVKLVNRDSCMQDNHSHYGYRYHMCGKSLRRRRRPRHMHTLRSDLHLHAEP